jgi:hypothetical protein
MKNSTRSPLAHWLHVLGKAQPSAVVAAFVLAACQSTEATVGTEVVSALCTKQEPKSCEQGQACSADEACKSNACVKGVCGAASCSDGAKGGDETGIDCGGTCKRCDGDACKVNVDCRANLCFRAKCIAALPCGEGKPEKCAEKDPCRSELDCQSDVCVGRVCEASSDARHSDGRRNAGETGIDCGGVIAATKYCPAGEGCVTSADCDGVCDAATKKCAAPSHADGKKNPGLGETDVDCGGDTPDSTGKKATACRSTKACIAARDCESGYCTTGVCEARKPGRKDGDETDIDCGGTADPDTTLVPTRCADDKGCAASADCTSALCNLSAKKCVTSKSCLSTGAGYLEGIMTCGAGEAPDPAKAHESCCRSLPTPTRGRLDKYEITAGRFRSFITDVGPNIRAWAATYVAANPSSQLAKLVAINPVVGNLYPAVERSAALNLVAHLGIGIDNYNGNRGCYNGAESYGANTYWQAADRISDYGMPPRVTPREELDQKSQNCMMPSMYAAFCAWDGGELATLADYRDVWTAAYPWGATDILRPKYNWCNGTTGNGGWSCQDKNLGNAGVFYEWPLGQERARGLEVWIAAPGRFIADRSALQSGGESWMDLYGNMAEYTGDFKPSTAWDFCDSSSDPAPGATLCTRTNGNVKTTGTLYPKMPTAGIIGVSWEGHRYERGSTDAFGVTFQYGKFGGRCVRPR